MHKMAMTEMVCWLVPWKRRFCILLLIMGWVGFAFEANATSDIVMGDIWIYAVLDDNPASCDKGFILGHIPISVDESNTVSHTQDWSGLVFPSGHIGGWIGAQEWWNSKLENDATLFCGVITSTVNRQTGKPYISAADMERLRGVLITAQQPSLKLTVVGSHVKVEPLQACCSPEGECVAEGVLWSNVTENCPEGTKPAGKGSYCFHCTALEVPHTPPKPDASARACCFNGYCEMLTPETCERLEGYFMENKMSCHPNPCPAPKVGCCMEGGKCDDLPPYKCHMLDGTPLNQLCSGDDVKDCQKQTGACMVGNHCFGNHTKASCSKLIQVRGQGGRFLGLGSKCPPPEPEKNACCIDGECRLETEEACRDKEGIFMSEFKTCEPDPCQKPKSPRGGCCDEFGTCINGVLEANCPEAKGRSFFPDGCPESCPIVQGACYIPCPTSADTEDCQIVSEKRCASISGRFEPNRKCVETGCLNCSPCVAASGKWDLNLSDEQATLILNDDCTSRMIIKKQSDENSDGLPITHPPQEELDGFWGCSDQTIRVSWVELGESVFVVAWEGDTMKLCYPEEDEMKCAERSESFMEMTVEFKGTFKGSTEGSQP